MWAVACKWDRLQSAEWREHISKALLGAGALSSAPSGAGPCESGLGHTHIPHPPATAPGTLTPTAACKLLAVMLSGTGTMWVAVEAIEAVFYRAFVVVSGAEIVVAGWRVFCFRCGFAILSMRLCVTP